MENLLTIEVKNKLKRDRRLRQIILVIVLIGTLFFVASVFNLALWLSFRIQKQVDFSTSTVAKTSSLSEKENIQAQEKITQLSKWWPNKSWVAVLKRIQGVQPRTLKISQIAGAWSDKTNTASLVLSGQAANRQDLVKFVDDLKQDKFFSKVNLPIDYLLSTSRGQFILNLEIKDND